jgi:predicted protein tyrosine phosphatase
MAGIHYEDTVTPGTIAIASLSRARRIKRNGFTGVMSFENQGQRLSKSLRFHRRPAPEQIILVAEDLDEPDGLTKVPVEFDAVRILEFGRRHANGALLVHCNAGISRSSAAALAILADRMGDGHEQDALSEMLRLRPCAVPNLLIVRHADNLLGRGGKLLDAVMAFDAASPWCQWRRIANAAAARGERLPPWPPGLEVPGEDDADGLVEQRT